MPAAVREARSLDRADAGFAVDAWFAVAAAEGVVDGVDGAHACLLPSRWVRGCCGAVDVPGGEELVNERCNAGCGTRIVRASERASERVV